MYIPQQLLKVRGTIQKFILDKLFPDKPNSASNIKPLKESNRSRHISQKVKDKVWNRDGGQCVECSSNEDLEFDHIIPHSKGGLTSIDNAQITHRKCNLKKGSS